MFVCSDYEDNETIEQALIWYSSYFYFKKKKSILEPG